MGVKSAGRLSKLPPAPKTLGDAGRKIWATEGKKLLDRGMLDEVFIQSFVVLCQQYDDLAHIDQVLAADGEYSKSSTGIVRAHPGLNLRSQVLDRICRLQRDFCLTPSSQTKEQELPKAGRVSSRPRPHNTNGKR